MRKSATRLDRIELLGVRIVASALSALEGLELGRASSDRPSAPATRIRSKRVSSFASIQTR